MTVICQCCRRVLKPGPADGPVSHGLGPCCWDASRAENGLSPKPHPKEEDAR